MTDDDKALVERLKRFSTRPIEHDAPAINRVAMDEAAERIEAQAAEIEKLRRDHAAAVKEANIAKARLEGVEKQWRADRNALLSKGRGIMGQSK